MKAKYALKALVVLAQNDAVQMQVKAIAQQANIPSKFLEAILGILKNRQIVNSRRGAAGGYALAKDSRKIMVADIIRIMDGPLAPIRCASMTSYQACADCPDETVCALHDVMKDVRAALSAVLDKRSIYDLAKYAAPKRKKVTK
ncbi:MAG TPA: Rrf2 family transcriptional regulator, partial [Alphaproteobacteria bacterium]|nr:Rrf2 family transcriptional regulator [Alphaproteobacteria bacterium]